MNRKIIIDEKPSNPILPNEIAHGNRKALSKSNIINKIATKYNLTSNSSLESSNGSNPHSYAESFSGSGLLGERIKLITTKAQLSPNARTKKIIIGK